MLKRGNFLILKAVTSIFAILICISKIHGSSNINTIVKKSDSNSELLESKLIWVIIKIKKFLLQIVKVSS